VAKQCSVTSETLSAFVDGELPPEQRRKLARHIVTCPSCSRQIGTIYSLKALAGASDQPLSRVPRGFWKRVRRRLDEIDAVARKVVSIGPKCTSTRRLATLGAAGVLMIILAVGIRGLMMPRPVDWTYLAKAHRIATAQLIPPIAVRQRPEPGAEATQVAWRLGPAQAIYAPMCSGRQVIYSRPGALVSYFALPCDSLDVSGLDFINQGGQRFYLTASDELSVVAWRQGPGWGVLVGATGTKQLLEMAGLYGKPDELGPGF